MSVGAAGKMGPVPGVWPRPEPFTPRADPAVLEDLRARLRATRWPDAPEDAGWSLGTDLDYLRELVAYWADEFDWSAQEAALARLPRFRVRLGGLRIHFVHARAAGPAGPVLPLVLTHGWPDSFWRYTKVIPLLTDPGAHGADPADAFDVVVPDMPGFGYSDRPPGPPLDSVAVAGLWAELMTVLGYPRFGAAGGDIGSHVSRYLALDHPDRVVAVHRTDAGAARLHRRPGRPRPRGTRLTASAAPPGAPPRAPTPPCTAPSPRPPPSGSPTPRPGSPRGSSRSSGRGATATATSSSPSPRTRSSPTSRIYWLTATIGSSMRMYHANAADPRRPAHPPGRGAVRLLAVRRRRRPPAAGLARAHRQRRARDRTAARRALRAVRGARALRRGAARVLPPLPNPSTLKAALPQPRGALPRGNEVHDAADVHA